MRPRTSSRVARKASSNRFGAQPPGQPSVEHGGRRAEHHRLVAAERERAEFDAALLAGSAKEAAQYLDQAADALDALLVGVAGRLAADAEHGAGVIDGEDDAGEGRSGGSLRGGVAADARQIRGRRQRRDHERSGGQFRREAQRGEVGDQPPLPCGLGPSRCVLRILRRSSPASSRRMARSQLERV